MPGQARSMDRMAIVRSLTHETSDHGAGTHWIMTGFTSTQQQQHRSNDAAERRVGRRQAQGAERAGRAALRGDAGRRASAVCPGRRYLGPGYNPFNLDGDPSGDVKVRNLEPPDGLTLDRLEDRQLPARPARPDRPPARRLGHDGRARPVHRPGVRDGHRPGRPPGVRPVARGPPAPRPLRPDPDRPGLPAGPPAGRGGRDLRHDHRGELGPPRPASSSNAGSRLPPLDAAVATLVEDLHDRGLAEQRAGPGLGRVRPHPADQRHGRPRPLAGQHVGACSPAAA